MEYTKDWVQKGDFVFSGEKPPRLIASIGTMNFGRKERLANAHLIAAAPDLYEALKGLAIAYNVDGEGVIVNQDPHYWQQALKAIAKAEGKGD